MSSIGSIGKYTNSPQVGLNSYISSRNSRLRLSGSSDSFSRQSAGVSFGCGAAASVEPPEFRPFLNISLGDIDELERTTDRCRYNVAELLQRKLDSLCADTSKSIVYEHLREKLNAQFNFDFRIITDANWDGDSLYSKFSKDEMKYFNDLRSYLGNEFKKELAGSRFLENDFFDEQKIKDSLESIEEKLAPVFERHDICCDGVAKQDCAKAILTVVDDDWYKKNNALFEDAMRHLLTNHKDECKKMVESYKSYFDYIELVEKNWALGKRDFLRVCKIAGRSFRLEMATFLAMILLK